MPGWGYPLQIKYQGRATPFRSNTSTVLSFRGEIPGWGYPLQIKYQDGAIPFRSNTRTLLSFRNIIPGWGYPLQIKYKGGIFHSDQIPGRCYPLGTKNQDGVIPFRSNTRTALSFRSKIPGWGYLLQIK